MAILYVLNETEKDGSAVTVGVFDYSSIELEKLSEYYGNEYTEVEHIDIEDSGLEWQKRIICDGEEVILTLHNFTLNEI